MSAGLALTLSERSPLWVPFTDLIFEKKDGMWRRSSVMPMPHDVLKVSIGEVEALYSLTADGIQGNYGDAMTTLTSHWVQREERNYIEHDYDQRMINRTRSNR